jgi:hypothetical protein
MNVRALVALLALPTAIMGCGSTVSAHVVDVEVDYAGVVTHGALHFPDYDEAIVGADSSCGLFKGNCGTTTSASATVSGNSPILGASMETSGEGSARIYDLAVRRAPGDEGDSRSLYGPNVRCRVYYSTEGRSGDFGKPTNCYNTTSDVSVTLTFRDGDDGQ